MRILASAAGLLIFIAVLHKSGVTSALFFFLTLGAIPGTSYSLPPLVMLGSVITAVWLGLFTVSKLAYHYSLKRD